MPNISAHGTFTEYSSPTELKEADLPQFRSATKQVLQCTEMYTTTQNPRIRGVGNTVQIC